MISENKNLLIMIFLTQLTKLTLLFVLFISFQSFTSTEGVLGTWIYQASGTPYEYSEGEIIVTKEEANYQVLVTVNYTNIKGQDVKIEKNKVSFSLYIEDEKINVTFMIDGDNLSGEASSYDGIFKLTGKRK